MAKLSLTDRELIEITAWTAVAQKTFAESAEIDIEHGASIEIQAFLDSATAHTGTEFVIETSSESEGDEHWDYYTSFIRLIGTANSEAITNNPLAAGSTTITCASTTGYVTDDVPMPKRAIEDGTLANSEIITQSAYVSNTSITIKDGTARAHVQNTLMWNIAISEKVYIPPEIGKRARVLVNNNYDSNGSSLNYRVSA